MRADVLDRIFQETDIQIYGDCGKCNSYGILYLKKFKFYLGKSCGCWQEEIERESCRHLVLNRRLENLRKLIARSIFSENQNVSDMGEIRFTEEGDIRWTEEGDIRITE